MKTGLVIAGTLLSGLAAAPAPAPKVSGPAAAAMQSPVPVSSAPVSGDYVEARTASVFAGACHYNGELVTTGRDAILAWNVSSGSWNGVDLAGVRAMAAITSDANLGDSAASRRCEVQIDPSATPAQAIAFAGWLQTRVGSSLGDLTAVHRGAVSFEHQGKAYVVNASGFATLAVQAMPNDECCSQPSLVWYSPLVPLEHRKVGYTTSAAYTAGTLGDVWQRADENSAFYGHFAQ